MTEMFGSSIEPSHEGNTQDGKGPLDPSHAAAPMATPTDNFQTESLLSASSESTGQVNHHNHQGSYVPSNVYVPPPSSAAASTTATTSMSTSPLLGEQSSPPENDPMDMTVLKDSMDAALASILDTNGTEPVLPPVTELSKEDDKQAQLRAMYLAGFRAAAAQQHRESLRNNFEDAARLKSDDSSQQLASSAPTGGISSSASGSAAAVLVPVASSVAAGVIKVQTPTLQPMQGMTQSRSSPSLIAPQVTGSSANPDNTSNCSQPTRRITRTSSGIASSPALSATSSPGSSGHSNPFPRKLMEMLKKEDSSVVSWLPNGEAFTVRDPDKFVTDILPRYFRHTKVDFLAKEHCYVGPRSFTCEYLTPVFRVYH